MEKISNFPQLPKSTSSMSYTYAYSGIKNFPTIPNQVTSLYGTFRESSLQGNINIPPHINNINYSFISTSINSVNISANIIYAINAFEGCSQLTMANIQSNKINNMSNMFASCGRL